MKGWGVIIKKENKNTLNYIKENHLNKILKKKTNEKIKHSQWLANTSENERTADEEANFCQLQM